MGPLILNRPVIAITGSSGKTTTKEMIASILSTRWTIIKTLKNRNQPRHTKKIAEMVEPHHQAVVLEFGMGRKNAGERHCRYIQPNMVVITNIGTAHYGKLGNSITLTARHKSALIEQMKSDGILFVNNDDPNSRLLHTGSFSGEIVTVGIKQQADYRAAKVYYLDKGMGFQATLKGKWESFFIPAFGLCNVMNALFAIAVTHRLGFTPAEIRSGLSSYPVPSRRMNLHHLPGGVLLIDDTYNANPEAVKAAVDVLVELGKGKKKIAVIGSMLELGNYSQKGHLDIGRYMVKQKIDLICAFGQKAESICKGAAGARGCSCKHFINRHELHDWLTANTGPSAAILVKGSNRMKMKETVEYLLLHYDANQSI